MRIKTSLILAWLVFAGVTVQAAPETSLTVAVYDFNGAGEAAAIGKKATTLITANLTTESNLVMVERSELNKALGEQSIGTSGLVSSDTAAKIGQITGAKVLVSGQVMKNDPDRLVIIANIIGTETSRLFSAQVEGPADSLMKLTTDLSQKIAQKIRDQAGNFVVETKSHEELLAHIVKSVTGTNRPSVSVNLHWPKSSVFPSATANTEMGIILQKAGFTVVDSKSDSKPDVEITGVIDMGSGPRRGGLFSAHAIIDAKAQERRTGKIIAFEHQKADGVDASKAAADKSAQVNAVDALAEKMLPALAN
jgi:TolB-like protein